MFFSHGGVRVRIGELSRKTGCRPVTIRFYEKEGLLGKPERTGGNYRLYGEDDLDRLRFVLHCREHDLALEEIRNLLLYRDSPDKSCAWVGEMLDGHIRNVEAQIRSLERLKKNLEKLRCKCPGGETQARCGIIKGLRNPKLCGCKD